MSATAFFEELLTGIIRGAADVLAWAEAYELPERDPELPPVETEAMFRLEDRLGAYYMEHHS